VWWLRVVRQVPVTTGRTVEYPYSSDNATTQNATVMLETPRTNQQSQVAVIAGMSALAVAVAVLIIFCIGVTVFIGYRRRYVGLLQYSSRDVLNANAPLVTQPQQLVNCWGLVDAVCVCVCVSSLKPGPSSQRQTMCLDVGHTAGPFNTHYDIFLHVTLLQAVTSIVQWGC